MDVWIRKGAEDTFPAALAVAGQVHRRLEGAVALVDEELVGAHKISHDYVEEAVAVDRTSPTASAAVDASPPGRVTVWVK